MSRYVVVSAIINPKLVEEAMAGSDCNVLRMDGDVWNEVPFAVIRAKDIFVKLNPDKTKSSDGIFQAQADCKIDTEEKCFVVESCRIRHPFDKPIENSNAT